MQGTLVGSMVWTSRPLPQQWAIRFPGDTSSYVDFGDQSILRSGNGFTVFFAFKPHTDIVSDGTTRIDFSMLIKSANTTDPVAAEKEVWIYYGTTILSGSSSSSNSYSINAWIAEVGGVNSFGTKAVVTRRTLNKFLRSNWQTLAITYNGKKTLRIYENGLRTDASGVGSQTLVSKANVSDSLLVGTGLFGRSGFKGDMERIAFWQKALSAKAVKQLHDDQSRHW